MKKIMLGCTGLEVSELCFGALPIGPAQGNKPVGESARVMSLALRSGINFFDTAQMYRTYEPIALAMKETGIRPVIATKSVAVTYEDMDTAVQEALGKLGTDYIDIFFLHAARAGTDVFDRREGALRCLVEYKKKGIIGFTGISAHAVDVVNLSAERDDIDVIFTIININGMGILRGSRKDMEQALEHCYSKGKGVMLMKVLGGGNLLRDYANAIDYARNISRGRACIALGMVAENEVTANINYFNGIDISDYLSTVMDNEKNMFVFKALCKNCNKCADACHSDAIYFDGNAAAIDASKCLKCGYCVTACGEFAIRFV
jgi:aryl-alcohol dehydrogenase-like predicted oxidoreductase/NAD-dependent dihydropyrimidine dehydrogenase PreA subunit